MLYILIFSEQFLMKKCCRSVPSVTVKHPLSPVSYLVLGFTLKNESFLNHSCLRHRTQSLKPPEQEPRRRWQEKKTLFQRDETLSRTKLMWREPSARGRPGRDRTREGREQQRKAEEFIHHIKKNKPIFTLACVSVSKHLWNLLHMMHMSDV